MPRPSTIAHTLLMAPLIACADGARPLAPIEFSALASLPEDFDLATGLPDRWPAGHAQLTNSGGALLAASMTESAPFDGLPSGPLRADALLIRDAEVTTLEGTEGLSLHADSPHGQTLSWSEATNSGAVRSRILAYAQSAPNVVVRFELPVPIGVTGLPDSEVTPFRMYATDRFIAWAPPVRRDATAMGDDYWTTPTWLLAPQDRLSESVAIPTQDLHSILGFDNRGRLMVARAEGFPATGMPVRIEFLDEAGTITDTVTLPICEVEGTSENWRCTGRPSESVRELHIRAFSVASHLFIVTLQRGARASTGVVLWSVSNTAEVIAQPADLGVHVSDGKLLFLERDARGSTIAARWDPGSETMARRGCALPETDETQCFVTALGALIVGELGRDEIHDRYGRDIDAVYTTAAAYLRPFDSDEERLLGDLCSLSESPEQCEQPSFLRGQTPGLAYVRDQDDTLFAIERPARDQHRPARRVLVLHPPQR